jgi:hypothetical protein
VRRTAWSIAGAPFLLPRKDSFYGQLRPGPPGFRSGCPPILALVREWCFNEGACGAGTSKSSTAAASGRAWRLSLPARRSDQARHAAVLVGVYGFLLLFLVQVKALIDAPLWLVATCTGLGGRTVSLLRLGIEVADLQPRPGARPRAGRRRDGYRPRGADGSLAPGLPVLDQSLRARLRLLRRPHGHLLLDPLQRRCHRRGCEPLTGPRRATEATRRSSGSSRPVTNRGLT